MKNTETARDLLLLVCLVSIVTLAVYLLELWLAPIVYDLVEEASPLRRRSGDELLLLVILGIPLLFSWPIGRFCAQLFSKHAIFLNRKTLNILAGAALSLVVLGGLIVTLAAQLLEAPLNPYWHTGLYLILNGMVLLFGFGWSYHELNK